MEEKFINFKDWCLYNEYCTQEIYDSVQRKNYSQEDVQAGKYSEAKQGFFELMYDHLKGYHKYIAGRVRREMAKHAESSLLYQALTYMEEDYAGKH